MIAAHICGEESPGFVGQDAGSVHVRDHLSGMFRNVAQALIAVQILGTCAKPEAIIL